MKKVIIIAVSILALACLASCNKGPKQCVCTATYMGETVSVDYQVENGTCETATYTVAGVSYSCKAK